MDIRSEVIKPDLFCPWIFCGRFVFEKDHVGLDPLGVKYAGGQPQDSVKIGILKELLPDRLAGASLEEHIVRNNRGRLTGGLEHGADMLDEIELLVGRSCPEVRPVVPQVLLILCLRPSAFFRLLSMVCSNLSQTERRDSISDTISSCSL